MPSSFLFLLAFAFISTLVVKGSPVLLSSVQECTKEGICLFVIDNQLFLLFEKKGWVCLSDSQCCPGLVCAKSNGQQEGFCSNGLETSREQEIGEESETGKETEAQDLQQTVSIFIKKMKRLIRLLTFLNLSDTKQRHIQQ